MSILTEWEINEIADKCKSSLGGVWPHAFYEVAEAMILEKLAGMELPEPEIKEAKFGGYDAYTATQLHQAYAQGAASQLSAEPFAWISSESVYRLNNGGNDSKGTVPVHANRTSVSKLPIYTLKQPK